MSEKVEIHTNGCANYMHILTIVFIVLKLTDNIDWSWFWVLSPSLFLVCVSVALFGTACLIALAAIIATKQ